MQAPRRDRTGKPVRERGGAVVVLRRLDLIDVNAVAETLGENERCFQLRCDKRVLTDAAQCGITLAPMADIADGLAEAVEKFLAQKEIPAIRKTKSGMKPCDIQPMIYDLKLTGSTLSMTLALCEKATCKPDLLLSSLFEFAGMDRPRMLITRVQLLGGEENDFKPLELL